MTRHGPEESPVREHQRVPALKRHCDLTPADIRATPILNQHIKTVLHLKPPFNSMGRYFAFGRLSAPRNSWRPGRYWRSIGDEGAGSSTRVITQSSLFIERENVTFDLCLKQVE